MPISPLKLVMSAYFQYVKYARNSDIHVYKMFIVVYKINIS